MAEESDPPPDPMSDEWWAASLACRADEDEAGDPDVEEEDLDSGMPAELAGVPMADIIAGAREVSAAEARAEALAGAGVLGVLTARRRGPRHSGPLAPGEYASPAAALAHGGALDTAVPCGTLALFAEDAAGPDGSYPGASADEIMGAVCAWDRMLAYATARMYQAIAAFIRHRPAGGCGPEGPGGLPRVWEEFTAAEIAHALAESRHAAETMLGTAHDLAAKLPGTMNALLDGDIRDGKARTIARATAHLDPAEARAAEEKVLDRAGRLTPGGLRAAIDRAVMEVAPEKAARRREQAARTRRVEVRPEESGNASVAARELSPELAAAIDQELSARARELKKAGLGEDTGDRRVLALLEKFGLARDLPGGNRGNGTGGNGNGGSDGGPGGTGGSAGAATAAGGGPAVRGTVNLTATLETLQGLRDRPGELAGHGPADPGLTRRLGGAALAHPQTKICVTVTDDHGVMTGHGCARPATRAEQDQLRRHRKPGPPSGAGPPGRTGAGLTLTPFPGPGTAQLHSGHGTWVLERAAMAELIVTIWPAGTDPCDHRMQAAGHDPGTELRHVTNLRYGTCTSPACRRPAGQCEFEHNIPHEADGRSCLCNGNPKCRSDHRLKQHPRWTVDQHPDGRIVWTAPTGRQATTHPHRYPV